MGDMSRDGSARTISRQLLLVCTLYAFHMGSSQHIWDIAETSKATTEASPWDPKKQAGAPRTEVLAKQAPKSLKQQKEAHDFQSAVAQASSLSPVHKSGAYSSEHEPPPPPQNQYHGPSINALETSGQTENEVADGQVPLWLVKMRMGGAKPADPTVRQAKATKEVDPWNDARSINDQYEDTQTHFLDSVAPIKHKHL